MVGDSLLCPAAGQRGRAPHVAADKLALATIDGVLVLLHEGDKRAKLRAEVQAVIRRAMARLDAINSCLAEDAP